MSDAIGQFVAWLKDVNWALSLLAAIPLSLVANLLTPAAAQWLARRSKQRSLKRIDLLRKEYAALSSLYMNERSLDRSSTESILRILLLIGLGSMLPAFFPFADFIVAPVGAVFYLMAVAIAQRQLTLIRRLRDISSLRKEILLEIRALGGSLDDYPEAQQILGEGEHHDGVA